MFRKNSQVLIFFLAVFSLIIISCGSSSNSINTPAVIIDNGNNTPDVNTSIIVKLNNGNLDVNGTSVLPVSSKDTSGNYGKNAGISFSVQDANAHSLTVMADPKTGNIIYLSSCKAPYSVIITTSDGTTYTFKTDISGNVSGEIVVKQHSNSNTGGNTVTTSTLVVLTNGNLNVNGTYVSVSSEDTNGKYFLNTKTTVIITDNNTNTIISSAIDPVTGNIITSNPGSGSYTDVITIGDTTYTFKTDSSGNIVGDVKVTTPPAQIMIIQANNGYLNINGEKLSIDNYITASSSKVSAIDGNGNVLISNVDNEGNITIIPVNNSVTGEYTVTINAGSRYYVIVVDVTADSNGNNNPKVVTAISYPSGSSIIADATAGVISISGTSLTVSDVKTGADGTTSYVADSNIKSISATDSKGSTFNAVIDPVTGDIIYNGTAVGPYTVVITAANGTTYTFITDQYGKVTGYPSESASMAVLNNGSFTETANGTSSSIAISTNSGSGYVQNPSSVITVTDSNGQTVNYTIDPATGNLVYNYTNGIDTYTGPYTVTVVTSGDTYTFTTSSNGQINPGSMQAQSVYPLVLALNTGQIQLNGNTVTVTSIAGGVYSQDSSILSLSVKDSGGNNISSSILVDKASGNIVYNGTASDSYNVIITLSDGTVYNFTTNGSGKITSAVTITMPILNISGGVISLNGTSVQVDVQNSGNYVSNPAVTVTVVDKSGNNVPYSIDPSTGNIVYIGTTSVTGPFTITVVTAADTYTLTTNGSGTYDSNTVKTQLNYATVIVLNAGVLSSSGITLNVSAAANGLYSLVPAVTSIVVTDNNSGVSITPLVDSQSGNIQYNGLAVQSGDYYNITIASNGEIYSFQTDSNGNITGDISEKHMDVVMLQAENGYLAVNGELIPIAAYMPVSVNGSSTAIKIKEVTSTGATAAITNKVDSNGDIIIVPASAIVDGTYTVTITANNRIYVLVITVSDAEATVTSSISYPSGSSIIADAAAGVISISGASLTVSDVKTGADGTTSYVADSNIKSISATDSKGSTFNAVIDPVTGDIIYNGTAVGPYTVVITAANGTTYTFITDQYGKVTGYPSESASMAVLNNGSFTETANGTSSSIAISTNSGSGYVQNPSSVITVTDSNGQTVNYTIDPATGNLVYNYTNGIDTYTGPYTVTVVTSGDTYTFTTSSNGQINPGSMQAQSVYPLVLALNTGQIQLNGNTVTVTSIAGGVYSQDSSILSLSVKDSGGNNISSSILVDKASGNIVYNGTASDSYNVIITLSDGTVYNFTTKGGQIVSGTVTEKSLITAFNNGILNSADSNGNAISLPVASSSNGSYTVSSLISSIIVTSANSSIDNKNLQIDQTTGNLVYLGNVDGPYNITITTTDGKTYTFTSNGEGGIGAVSAKTMLLILNNGTLGTGAAQISVIGTGGYVLNPQVSACVITSSSNSGNSIGFTVDPISGNLIYNGVVNGPFNESITLGGITYKFSTDASGNPGSITSTTMLLVLNKGFLVIDTSNDQIQVSAADSSGGYSLDSDEINSITVIPESTSNSVSVSVDPITGNLFYNGAVTSPYYDLTIATQDGKSITFKTDFTGHVVTGSMSATDNLALILQTDSDGFMEINGEKLSPGQYSGSSAVLVTDETGKAVAYSVDNSGNITIMPHKLSITGTYTVTITTDSRVYVIIAAVTQAGNTKSVVVNTSISYPKGDTMVLNLDSGKVTLDSNTNITLSSATGNVYKLDQSVREMTVKDADNNIISYSVDPVTGDMVFAGNGSASYHATVETAGGQIIDITADNYGTITGVIQNGSRVILNTSNGSISADGYNLSLTSNNGIGWTLAPYVGIVSATAGNGSITLSNANISVNPDSGDIILSNVTPAGPYSIKAIVDGSTYVISTDATGNVTSVIPGNILLQLTDGYMTYNGNNVIQIATGSIIFSQSSKITNLSVTDAKGTVINASIASLSGNIVTSSSFTDPVTINFLYTDPAGNGITYTLTAANGNLTGYTALITNPSPNFDFSTVTNIQMNIMVFDQSTGSAIPQAQISFVDGSGKTTWGGFTNSSGTSLFTATVTAASTTATVDVTHSGYVDIANKVSNIGQLVAYAKNIAMTPDGTPNNVPVTPQTVTGVYTLAFEDNYPSEGDADFNDVVVRLTITETIDSSNNLQQIVVSTKLLASGAGYNSIIGINIYGNRIILVPNIRTALGTDSFTYTDSTGKKTYNGSRENAMMGETYQSIAPVTYTLKFSTPVARSNVAAMPYDPFIICNGVNGGKNEVHLPFVNTTYGGVNGVVTKDSSGFVWGLLVPDNWNWPYENNSTFSYKYGFSSSIYRSYPNYQNWISSKGQTNADWYNYPNKNYVFPWPGN